MNKIDLTNLGGLPVTQYTFDFLQQSYSTAFMAMAMAFGDKVILYGVEESGSQLTNGWISLNGELLQFVGGTKTDYIDIVETKVPRVFEDNISKDVYITRVATSTVAPGYLYSEFERLSKVKDTVPAGVVLPFGGLAAPSGWLMCDGTAKLIASYPKLYAAIGTRFGGDGVTNFNLPSPSGKTIVGVDATDANLDQVGKVFGSKTHTLTVAEMPAHSHPMTGLSKGSGDGTNMIGFEPGSKTKNTSSVGGGQAHNIMQPSLAMNQIIKY